MAPYRYPSKVIRWAWRDYKDGMGIVEVSEKHGISNATLHRRFLELFGDEYRAISAKNRKDGERRGGIAAYSLGHIRRAASQA